MIELPLEDRKDLALKEITAVLEKYGFEISVEANAVLVPTDKVTTAQTGIVT